MYHIYFNSGTYKAEGWRNSKLMVKHTLSELLSTFKSGKFEAHEYDADGVTYLRTYLTANWED